MPSTTQQDTTQTTLNSYGVDMPEPTPRQLEAVALFDSGVTSNADIGNALGIQPGAAGNLKIFGLERMGRSSDVQRTGPTGGRNVAPKSPREMIEQTIAGLRTKLANIGGRTDSVREELTALDTDDGQAEVIAAETERREAAVTAAIAARDALVGRSNAAVAARQEVIDAARERLTARLDSVSERVGETREAVEANIAEWEAVLATMPAPATDTDAE